MAIVYLTNPSKKTSLTDILIKGSGMHTGIGLSITGNNGRGRKSTPPEDTIKTAIKERKHIRAVWDGVNALIQPYALLKVEGASILHGVIVVVEGDAVGSWGISVINVAALSSVEIYYATFIPVDAFDGNSLSGVLAVVEGFDPFKDGSERAPG